MKHRKAWADLVDAALVIVLGQRLYAGETTTRTLVATSPDRVGRALVSGESRDLRPQIAEAPAV